MHYSNSYDELSYYSQAFSFCHIAALETQGYFWGLTPPDISTARVLELGCSFGGNLISQALYYPNAKFVGIDLSKNQINRGNMIIAEMGLNNIQLLQKDILDIHAELGQFDYIIVHGVYSWVPDAVKEKILNICHENLSEHGLAYISYNTYPGWKNKDVIRDMMLFSNRQEKSWLEDNIKKVRNFTNSFAQAFIQINENQNLARLQRLQEIEHKTDHYLVHEYLDNNNDPIYLHEFIKRTEVHQLAYVCDLDWRLSSLIWIPDAVQRMIKKLAQGDQLKQEQYLDYLYDTSFRRSLLCHLKTKNNRSLSLQLRSDLFSKCTYLPVIHSPNLDGLFKQKELVDIFSILLSKKCPFKLQQIQEIIIQQQLNSTISLNTCYECLHGLIVLGYIQPYVNSYSMVDFEENNSYVPVPFIRYANAMMKGADKYISFADMYNRHVTFFDQLHFFTLLQLSRPTTKYKIAEALKSRLLEIHAENVDEYSNLLPLVTEICERLSALGYLRNKK